MDENLPPQLSCGEIERIKSCFICRQLSALYCWLEYFKDFYITEDISDLTLDKLRKTKFYKALVGTHQNHIRRTIKEAAVKNIYKEINELRKLRDFDNEILPAVEGILKASGMKIMPSLWAYDVSMRIAYSIGNEALPKRKVYIFQHAKTGAINLFGQKIKGNTLDLPMMQNIFKGSKGDSRKLESHEIEQLLCHCRHCIKDCHPLFTKKCDDDLKRTEEKTNIMK